MKGKASIRSYEQQQTAWLAWHIELLARVKKMPKLEEFLRPFSPRGRKLPDQETLVKLIKTAFGYPGDKPQ